MKTKVLKTIGMAAVVAFTMSCKENENQVDASDAAQEAETTAEAITYTVDGQKSTIQWVGSKPTADHTGTIAFDGTIQANNDEIQSGTFNIDMNSINVTDLEGEMADNLTAHLTGTAAGKETDFFNTAKYPTAKFVVTGINQEAGKTILKGNLTLKEVTKNVSFPVETSISNSMMTLKSEQFVIDRTQWGIQYGSASLADVVADKAISDDIKLTISMVASAQ